MENVFDAISKAIKDNFIQGMKYGFIILIIIYPLALFIQGRFTDILRPDGMLLYLFSLNIPTYIVDVFLIIFWTAFYYTLFFVVKNLGIYYDESNKNYKTKNVSIPTTPKTINLNELFKKIPRSASKSGYGKVIGLLTLGLILIIALMPRVENATYRAKCEFYSTTSGTNWDKFIYIEYTTGMFWNQSFTINHHIKLEDVSTFKGHAEGTIYSGYRGKQANFIYDEVYKSLYIESKLNQKYSDDERIHALVRYNCK